MSELIKKQHYVPRHYLKAWSNKNIQTLLKLQNRIINVKLTGVCQENRFYKLNKLSNDDINKLNNFIDDLFKEFGELKNNYKYFIALSKFVANDNKLSINLFEKYLSNIEQNGCKMLQCKNIDEFKNIYNLDILFYIVIQFCRTNKIKQNIINDTKEQSYLNIFPQLIFLIASKYTFNLYYNVYTKFVFLINNTNIPFITGDQPIINISKDENDILYYPLSPKYALLINIDINMHSNKNDFYEECVNETFVKEKNKLIYDNAYNFVFSIDKNILEELNKNN